MARDFEDIHDLDDLSDSELRELVREHLRASGSIDPDDVTVRVVDSRVTLEGRVGTDGERRIAEHVVSDLLGLTDYENNIFVDPVRRAVTSEDEDLDDVLVEQEETGGVVLDREVALSPEAEHTVEDIDGALYGTSDVHRAIQNGTPWVPPEGPTPEGVPGENERGEFGEDH